MQDFLQWIVGVFTVGLPWISRFQALNCHFRVGLQGTQDQFDTKDLFNASATVFSIPIYLFFVVPSSPQEFLLRPGWVGPFVLSVTALIAFFYVFLKNKVAVERGDRQWPVILNLFLYLATFLLLTLVFGYLVTLHSYRVVRGTVLDHNTPVLDAVVTLQVSEKGPDGSYKGTEQLERITDRDGSFMVAIDKAKAFLQLQVSKTGYLAQDIPMSSEREIDLRISLEKEEPSGSTGPTRELQEKEEAQKGVRKNERKN